MRVFFITYVGVHSASWQCLGILKTNDSVLWLYLVLYLDIKRLRYYGALEKKSGNIKVLPKWTKKV